jgi:transposase
MAEKYIVRLTAEEREELTALVSKGQSSAAKIRHAQVLLKADADGPNWSDPRIADAFSMHLNTVAGIRKRWVEQGLDAALNRKPQAWPSRTSKLDGAGEARVLAVSCSEPPPGQARWSLRLLADRVVELGIVPSFSYESVRRVLKKRTQAPFVPVVGDSARAERRVRGPDGRPSGYLLPAR